MKRNKTTARAQRGGVSPYKRYGKRPCQHCQQITAESKRRATTGGDYVKQAL